MTTPQQKKPSILNRIANMFAGGISGMVAVSILLPLDMIKVRIQISSEAHDKTRNPFKIAKRIYQNEGGIKAFYRGIDSALLRQATFTSLRLGLFTNFGEMIKKKKNKKTLTLSEKSLCSLSAGGIAAFIDTPLDLSLIRMQADRTLPPELQRRYRNVFHAFTSVIKEEGPIRLWKGAPPTVCRAMVANFAMLTSYEEAKERLEKVLGKGKHIAGISSAIAGFCAASLSLPFDNVKTKIQKMKIVPGTPCQYNGVFDCIFKTIKNEGPFRLWVGLPTYYVRVAPQAMITLLIYDSLRKLLN